MLVSVSPLARPWGLGAGGEVDVDAIARAAVVARVGAGPAIEAVTVASAIEGIGPVAAIERVAAGAAVEAVGAAKP